MPLSHYDHESQESPRIDKFQDSWGFVIPLLHYDHDQNSLRIYTELVGTSRTDKDSTTIPENCQFLEIRGICGRSVIGV